MKNGIYKIWLFLIVLMAGGQVFAQVETQIKKTDEKADNAETLFEKVFEGLKEEPKWLFEGFVCPFDVFPVAETKLNYSKSRCAENAEACLNECRNKDGNSCYALALVIQDKKGIDQQYSEALFLRACKLGIASGCTNRAAKIFDSEDEKSIACAAKTFEKTCELNDTWGCTMFGFALWQGLGVAKDTERALTVLTKSCKLNEQHEACESAKQVIEKIKESKTKH